MQRAAARGRVHMPSGKLGAAGVGRIDQRGERARRVVRGKDVHDGAQDIGRVILRDGHDPLAELLAAILSADIAQDRLLPRVVHDGVELPPGQVAPADAVGDLVRRVLPHLADEDGVRLQLAQALSQPRQKCVRQLVHHIEAVAVSSEAEPVRKDAVLVLNDIADVAFVHLIDARQRGDAPPAFVYVGIVLELEPVAVGGIGV